MYRAPSECPDRSTFIGLLTRRVPTGWLATDADLAATFAITLEADGDEFVARMDGKTVESQALLRIVRAKRCEEAVSGIALVTALAMEAQRSGHAGADVGAGAAVVQPDPKPPADETTRATPKPKETAPETHASGSHAAPRRSAEAATHPGFAMHEVALRLALANGLGPSVAKGAGVEWGIGARPYLPFLRLAASWSESGSRPANYEDGAHFRLVAGKLDGCLGWTIIGGPRLMGAACAGIELDATPQQVYRQIRYGLRVLSFAMSGLQA